MRRAIINGQIVWVDDHGKVIGISAGLHGAEPGLSDLRERDIMSRLPDADIVGRIGPGVVPGGEKSAGVMRAEALGIPLPPGGGAPLLPTHRPLAGAQVNNRGNIQIVTLHTNDGGPEQFVPSIVETAKDGGIDAEVISVQLGLELPEQLTSLVGLYILVPINIVAIVEWGVGNAFFSAEVDWNQGTSFSICANWIRVSARVGAIAQQVVPDIAITLKASLAYGNSQNVNLSSAARRTLAVVPGDAGTDFADQGLAAGATSTVIPIPLWSLGVTLVDAGSLAALTPDYTLTLSGDPAQSQNLTKYKVTSRTNLSNNIEGQFPVPARRRFISVTNNLGVIVASPTLIFNLGF